MFKSDKINVPHYHNARVKGFWLAAAQIASDIFSPLLVPVYCTALSLWVTPLKFIPERPRLLALGVIFLLTAVLPFCLMIVLIKKGRLKDMAATDRRQRMWPFAFAVVCYVASAVYLRMVNAPLWMSLFFAGSALAVVVDIFITLKWRISAHSTAMGGFMALSFWLALHHLLTVDAIIWLPAVLLLAGMVGTSRVALGRHNSAQVFAGWAVGATCVYLLISFF